MNLPATTPATQATVAAAEATVASGNKRKRSAPKSDENKPAIAGGKRNNKLKHFVNSWVIPLQQVATSNCSFCAF